MEGGTLVGESLVVTIIVLLYFGCFFIFGHKAEQEVQQWREDKLKSVKKSR